MVLGGRSDISADNDDTEETTDPRANFIYPMTEERCDDSRCTKRKCVPYGITVGIQGRFNCPSAKSNSLIPAVSRMRLDRVRVPSGRIPSCVPHDLDNKPSDIPGHRDLGAVQRPFGFNIGARI